MDALEFTELTEIAAAPPGFDIEPEGLAEASLEGPEADAFREAGWRFVAADADIPGLRAVYRGPQGRLSIEGASVIVRFADEAAPELIKDVLDKHHLLVQRQIKFIPQGFKLKRREQLRRGELTELSKELQQLDFVTYADPDFVEVLGKRSTSS